jgi:transposase
MLEAMIWVLRTGAPWRDLPEGFGPWETVYGRFRRWLACGLWERLLHRVARYSTGKLRHMDATCCKVHQFARGGHGGPCANHIGRTKGGNNTKIHALVDSKGLICRVLLSAGQVHESALALALTKGLPKGCTVVGDKAYDTDAHREHWQQKGLGVCVPPREGRKHPARYDRAKYRKRHAVENFFQRLKMFLRIDRRLDKLAATFLAFVQIASVLDAVNYHY